MSAGILFAEISKIGYQIPDIALRKVCKRLHVHMNIHKRNVCGKSLRLPVSVLMHHLDRNIINQMIPYGERIQKPVMSVYAAEIICKFRIAIDDPIVKKLTVFSINRFINNYGHRKICKNSGVVIGQTIHIHLRCLLSYDLHIARICILPALFTGAEAKR